MRNVLSDMKDFADEAIISVQVSTSKAEEEAESSLCKRAKETLFNILMCSGAVLSMILCLVEPGIVASANGLGATAINDGFKSLLEIVKALVSSIGTIVLLWGFFEWGTSLQSQDGVMQSSAFKRIGGGLVMVLAPQLVGVFSGTAGGSSGSTPSGGGTNVP